MSAELSSDGVTVVLDTNVLISLYVFADSQFATLRNHIEAGRWQVVTNEACLAEFVRVLNYPLFKLEAEAQSVALTAYRNVAIAVAAPAQSALRVLLPRCTDADDQKFLELARDSQAAFLITSDKALLKLARRLRQSGMFHIITPVAALAELCTNDSVAPTKVSV